MAREVTLAVVPLEFGDQVSIKFEIGSLTHEILPDEPTSAFDGSIRPKFFRFNYSAH